MSNSEKVPHTCTINFRLSKRNMGTVALISWLVKVKVGKATLTHCHPSGDQTIILNHVCCIKNEIYISERMNQAMFYQ